MIFLLLEFFHPFKKGIQVCNEDRVPFRLIFLVRFFKEKTSGWTHNTKNMSKFQPEFGSFFLEQLVELGNL